MAQSIAGTGKRRSVVDGLKEQDSSKRLKQGRLSFQPLGCKPLTPLNNTSASRKRKLSEHDSPKTKLPKVPDLKNSCEKVDPDDNEVSSTSASETECLNVNCAKSITGKANLLEKFVRREDEISSTNDVIDLTDSLDENDPKENSPVKTRSPRKSVHQSPRSKPENCLKDKIETNFSRKLTFDKEESVKKETESVLGENDSPSKRNEKEPENVSMECVKTADVQEGKDVNTEGTTLDQVDDIVTPSKSQSLNSSVCEISASPSITPQKEEEESSTSSKTPAGKEDLSPACTPQTPASANSSISSEGTTPLTGSKKKRVLSKKQEERAAVRQKVKGKKEKQKQDAKEQKEKERLEKKQKRDDEKAEKERMKKEEKEKKEQERLEKKEQVEKEKQMKLQQKDEEKQKKMEKINAKLEEKKMKEEEKRLKEEQKQKEEEEKVRQTQKRKEVFTSFFIKPKAVTSTKVTKAEDNLFIPFELKKDMTLAPVKRQWLSEQDTLHLDSILKCEEKAKLTYVDELKQGIRKPPRTNRILRKKKEIEQEVELLVHDSETVKKVTHAVKLLQFHTDYRPPYYGTWHKKVKGLSPRNPWKKDGEVFDYEVDSDEEWEEEEPGESLSDSNGEEEDGEEEEEEGEDDGWMVPHGYLSEDEGCQDDEEVTPEVLKARQRAKALAWEADLKAKKQVLPPIYLGCFWLDKPCPNEEHLAIFRTFETVCIRSSPIETLVSCPAIADGVGEKSADTASVKASPNSRCRKRALPEEAMPDLIRLVHGNTFGIKKLVREFRLYWKQKCNDTNVSLDESRMEEETKALNDSVMDTSVNLDQSTVKTAESPVSAEATEQEPMETDCKDKTAEEEVSSKKQEDSIVNDESSDSCVSKRQLEIKITAIAVREKREGKKPCWYVNDSVLKQYNMEDLSLENSWVYVSGDMTKKSEKKTPNQLKEKKTPTQSAETPVSKSKNEGKPTPMVLDEDGTTPHKGKNTSTDTTPKSRKGKKEGSAKKTPKDQPSIMAFAKKAVGESTGEKTGNTQNKDANQNTSDSTEEIINGDHKTADSTKPDCAKDPAGSQPCVQQMEEEDCIILD